VSDLTLRKVSNLFLQGACVRVTPLSPYLFLLCTEGLTSLLLHAEWSGELKGAQVCRDAPAISNLLFAVDSLILMQAMTGNANCLR
jgi:hypothetical protein